jgi:hypothetical protein
MEVDFKVDFINIDFDNKLLENNNPLLNSQQHYIAFKQRYIKDTLSNSKKYTALKGELEQLENMSSYTDTKFVHVYIDDNKVSAIKQSIKNIILHQRVLLSNFLNYIDYLNSNVSLLQPNNPTTKTRRLFQLFKN